MDPLDPCAFQLVFQTYDILDIMQNNALDARVGLFNPLPKVGLVLVQTARSRSMNNRLLQMKHVNTCHGHTSTQLQHLQPGSLLQN